MQLWEPRGVAGRAGLAEWRCPDPGRQPLTTLSGPFGFGAPAQHGPRSWGAGLSPSPLHREPSGLGLEDGSTKEHLHGLLTNHRALRSLPGGRGGNQCRVPRPMGHHRATSGPEIKTGLGPGAQVRKQLMYNCHPGHHRQTRNPYLTGARVSSGQS